ncbi:uncharacterized protein LOC120435957 isoform X1 [Oreochromis aureus]|uniref:uncharacterized protein LOC120435957 isoform X1 n=1 Tax=Oreochromis aureus TaxID=47969 RepID=UPI00195361BE|nr:uncharacterized protein LOC120435957 isoform X1 [Oreochromis aureus]
MMEKTLALRRQEVVREAPMIADFKMRWPALFHVCEVSAEFKRITTIHLQSKFFSQLDSYSANLMKIYAKKGGIQGRKINTIMAPATQTAAVEVRRECILKGVCVYLNEDPEKLVKDYLMHISIWHSGLKPELQECNTCCRGLFHCPLCPTFSPTVRAKIEEHLNVHIKNALPFKDKMICRCRLPCRTTGHFHCPVCEITIIQRGDMARHLLSCQHSSMPSQPPLSGLLPAELSKEPRLPPAALSEEPCLPPAALSEETRIPPAALSVEPRLSPAALSVEPHLPLDVLSPAYKPFSESSVEHSCVLPSVLNETVACGKSMKMKRPHCGLSLLTKKTSRLT